MKWILVWWIINPGHSQVMHLERGFPSEGACVAWGAKVAEWRSNQQDKPQLVRWHCSQE
jgi:hypothetical protein